MTDGPVDGVLYEHRTPCGPEKEKILRHHRKIVRTGKAIVLVGWILVPLAFLLVQQFIGIVGWIAFAYGIFQLGVTTIKHFGNPDRWIPGYKSKKDEERRNAHYIYHCERNPEGFARLRAENAERDERERNKQKSPADP